MNWMLYALLSAFCTGIATLLLKIGLKNGNPTFSATIHTTITAFMLLFISPILRVFPRTMIQGMNMHAIIFVTLAGIVSGISWIFYLIALQEGTVTTVLALAQFSLMVTLVLCYFFLGDPFYPQHVIGIVLLILGVYFISLQ